MALVRWEPARELQSIHQEVSRLLGTFFDTQAGGGVGNGASATRRWVPAVDLVQEGERYVLRADLPGLTEDDVKIEVSDGVLTVSGERSSQGEERNDGYYRLERSSGRFSRSVRLPVGVDAGAIEASFEHGVLEVKIPKPEQAKRHRVEIKATGGARAAESGAQGGEHDRQG